MEYYYQILGLTKNASEAEIKKAYRRLARKYHPDVSTEPDAEERFIEISEAYQYLLEKPVVEEFSYVEEEPVPTTTLRERQEAARRERARQFAQMRYEQFRNEAIAFQKAWYFMPVKVFTHAVVYIFYAVAAGMFLSPLIAWFFLNNVGMAIGFVFLAMVSPHAYSIASVIKNETKKYFEDFETPRSGGSS